MSLQSSAVIDEGARLGVAGATFLAGGPEDCVACPGRRRSAAAAGESSRRSKVRSRNTRRGVSWLVMLVSGLGVVGLAETAHALPLVTLSGSLRGLYGSALGDQGVENTELNPYGIGIGLRGGVTLPAALYLGASFDYFFGESDDAIDIEFNLYQVMGNVGYDIGLGPLTLRPSLGLGVASISVDARCARRQPRGDGERFRAFTRRRRHHRARLTLGQRRAALQQDLRRRRRGRPDHGFGLRLQPVSGVVTLGARTAFFAVTARGASGTDQLS